jgi:tripeptide aminopeptidase
MTAEDLLKDLRIQKGFQFIEDSREELLMQIANLASIPSPSYKEDEIATYYGQLLTEAGVENVSVDKAKNAYGVIRGTGGGPALLMNAHLDTVFPVGTDLTIKRDENRMYGPGIGDDSAGLGALLWAVKALMISGIKLKGDLYVAGNACEEGLGDLNGMKALMEALKDRVSMVIPVEPSPLGRIANQGVGSRRFKITARTQGGHSWGAFGAPSAIHALSRVVSQVSEIKVPKVPKTTYNVGKFQGGVSINTIAPDASLELDMRSVDSGELSKVEQQVHSIIENVARTTGVSIETVLVGDSPAGSTPENDPLIDRIKEVHKELGIQSFMHAGSTDANVPMWLGIPAATIGVTTGANAHSLAEYIDTAPITRGVEQVFLLMVYLLS